MPRIARRTDPISHGGQIIEGSPDTITNGLETARKGDAVMCAIHGLVAIADGSPDVITNGKRTARLGDPITCGAVIVDQVSPDTVAN